MVYFIRTGTFSPFGEKGILLNLKAELRRCNQATRLDYGFAFSRLRTPPPPIIGRGAFIFNLKAELRRCNQATIKRLKLTQIGVDV